MDPTVEESYSRKNGTALMFLSRIFTTTLRLHESVLVNEKLIYDQFATKTISSKITSKLRRTFR
ncbi:hypothetical protein YC2023_059670 [Brassica napus]